MLGATVSGTNITTGEAVCLEFGRTIQNVRPIPHESTDLYPEDMYLARGFVDLQVNGFAGVDFNNSSISWQQADLAIAAVLSTGVTRFLPTVITGSPDDMLASLRNLNRIRKRLPRGKAMAGFHVEGPHIGADDGPRGAHPLRWVRPPDPEEFHRWQEATDGNIRLVTLSPHWPEAPEYIEALVREGVAVSIGHTGASAEQITAAVNAGATLSTHVGNAAHAVLRRHPNYLWDQLAEDRLSASFIVDGIHLGDAFLRVALRAKGVAKTILVTDAAAPAGAMPGPYRLGELEVELTMDDRVVLKGTGKLAGSSLRMNRAIPNVVRISGVSLPDAVQMASANPARLIGLTGELLPGAPADIVVFKAGDPLQIQAVYLDGENVYSCN